MSSVIIPGVRDDRIFCLDLPVEAQAYVDAGQFAITVDAINAIERRRLRHLKQQDLAETRCCICAMLCCCCCLGAIPFYCAIKRHHKGAERMAAKYYQVLAEHNEKYYQPTGVTLKVGNNTVVASGIGYSASSTKYYLTIEISPRPAPADQPAKRSVGNPLEESAVVRLLLMTTPTKEVSIRIVDDATFADLLIDATPVILTEL